MVSVFDKAIHNNYRLQPKKKRFIFERDVEVHPGGLETYGFKLDKQGDSRPFPFFKDSPPLHVAKMCDGIFVFADGPKLFCALIEQKGQDEKEFERQLANGKLFCQWLVSIFQQHKHIPPAAVTYVGVLVWEPTPFEQKDLTAYTKPKALPHDLFHKFFKIENEKVLYLVDLI